MNRKCRPFTMSLAPRTLAALKAYSRYLDLVHGRPAGFRKRGCSYAANELLTHGLKRRGFYNLIGGNHGHTR